MFRIWCYIGGDLILFHVGSDPVVATGILVTLCNPPSYYPWLETFKVSDRRRHDLPRMRV